MLKRFFPFLLAVWLLASMLPAYAEGGTSMADMTMIYQADETIEALADIQVEAVEGSITVRCTSGNDVRMEIFLSDATKREEYDYGARRDGNRLQVWIKRKNPITRYFGFLNLFNQPKVHINVYVPEAYQEWLSANTVAGHVDVSDMRLSQLSISNVSGGLTMKDCEAETTKLSTTSGRVIIDTVASQSLDAHSVSGGIQVNDSSARTMVLKTTSGGVEADNIRADSLDAGTMSGGITVNDLAPYETGQQVKASSVSGGVRLELLAVYQDVQASAVSGGVDLTVPDKGSYTFKCGTVSGRVNVYGTSYGKDVTVAQDGAVANARLSTTSGGITVVSSGQ